ncbi:proton-conducting transporter transmembrane domain-containing protein [Algisphaera agarilytica]|uniref:Multicomponent Na+:H+ antiporter subunit D n=1 Tax=Algisphaera agarilytica TaxID=1385975 RepID=A0A7X0H3K9_9BACT|nr:proton-conducting transporter membrane subunit [Algisphaera agarilytica]MBB6428443.1 multicomponent Na+:H+ antiporter subunit D [Algisphaera agarilytica]
MTMLPVLPILIPLLAAAACLLSWRSVLWQRVASTIGAVGLLGSAIALLITADRHDIVTVQIGSWSAPFGITLVADRFSAIMVLLAGTMGLLVCLFSLFEATRRDVHRGFFPLLLILLAGVCGAFLTGDLFNLYVWFEVLLIASFVLLGLVGGRANIEGAVKYVALNLVGSMLFLTATGVLYGVTKTLNMADLHGALREVQAQNPTLVLTLAATFAVAFGLKAALFPLFFWLPASYHVPPAAVCAVFAALLTKVGVYALVRVFTLVFPDAEPVLWVILILAAITMVSGVLGAVTQYEFKRILAWHSISQVGYIVAGVGLLAVPDPEVQALGLAAAVVFLVHHGTIKPALFLVAGLVKWREGTTELRQLGGLAGATPWLAALFLLAALSLAGLPPSSGFWAKLAVLRALVVAQEWWVLAAALAAGLLTLMSMMKIWNEAFWKDRPLAEKVQGLEGDPALPKPHAIPKAFAAPVVALIVLVTAIGLWPQPLLGYADRAAAQLLTPSAYVEAVGVPPREINTTPDDVSSVILDVEEPQP